MKLTPLDIKKQEFKKTFRGFDPIEVETFLEMVAEEYEALIRERNALSDEVIKLKTQLRDYQQVEKTFKESLMNAQQTIEQSKENSKRESDLVLKEAELKAEKMLESTKLKLAEMKNELILIKSQKESFAKRLKHLLESQLELIGILEIDDLGLGDLERPMNPNPEYAQTEKKSREEIQFKALDEEAEKPLSLLESNLPENAELDTHGNIRTDRSFVRKNELYDETPEHKNASSSKTSGKKARLSDQFIM
ncbi:DivIVA domain-containing protein [candidate division KSB1 bacterium]|nr:DivIVA domain-containing protein [candidate division KSB1 bacterium]